ncbi:hypothetical protein [Kitasatospora acidiphila]|uniref:hypothetical protein n=1 Tax=Kitasatospora acidiphila TaxID=2567942 RepID=UPI003898F387
MADERTCPHPRHRCRGRAVLEVVQGEDLEGLARILDLGDDAHGTLGTVLPALSTYRRRRREKSAGTGGATGWSGSRWLPRSPRRRTALPAVAAGDSRRGGRRRLGGCHRRGSRHSGRRGPRAATRPCGRRRRRPCRPGPADRRSRRRRSNRRSG